VISNIEASRTWISILKLSDSWSIPKDFVQNKILWLKFGQNIVDLLIFFFFFPDQAKKVEVNTETIQHVRSAAVLEYRFGQWREFKIMLKFEIVNTVADKRLKKRDTSSTPSKFFEPDKSECCWCY